jgi:methionyl-tRNA formyltransferase
MGTPQAAVPSLERLLADGHEIAAVYTQPDRPAGRGNKVAFSPVKQTATDHDLPVLQPEKIKTDEALEEFVSHQADAAVVVAYGRILPESFLTTFPHGAINLHFSLLPKYRGAAPVNWAIARGETETGVTTMRMDAGLDTGPILLQAATEIESWESSVDLTKRLAEMGAELLSETLNRLAELQSLPQDDAVASHAPILKREDGLIDWMMNSVEISNRVRGFQLFPTSFTYLDGHRLTVRWAVPSAPTADSVPGRIAAATGDELIVECGAGSTLRITEIQMEGKRKMATRDFVNGHKPQVGTILGN